MSAAHVLNLATTAGVLAMIACPVLAIIMAGLVRWNGQLVQRNTAQAVTIGTLQRRLSDVEAIRAPDTEADTIRVGGFVYSRQLLAGGLIVPEKTWLTFRAGPNGSLVVTRTTEGVLIRDALERAASIAEAAQKYEGSDHPVCRAIAREIRELADG